MKTLYCVTILLMLGVTSAFAQSDDRPANADKKGRDRLFPEFATDQVRLKKSETALVLKPKEAQASNPRALRETIFTNYKPGVNNLSQRPALRQTATQKLSSDQSSADALKARPELKEQPKITVPDQTQK